MTAAILVAALLPNASMAGDRDDGGPTRAADELLMSPDSRVAVATVLGVLRASPPVDARVAQLANEVSRTRLLAAQCRTQAGVRDSKGPCAALRQHAAKLRAIQSELARSDRTAPAVALTALEPRLLEIERSLDAAADAGDARSRGESLDSLAAALASDRDAREPQPTIEQPPPIRLVVPSVPESSR